MKIPDEAIQAVTRALHEAECGSACGEVVSVDGYYGRRAKIAVEAVAPLIAAQVLRAEEIADLQTIDERDSAEHWADLLAGAIADHFGHPIGEHSNDNNPWWEALKIIQTPGVSGGTQ